MKPTDLFRFGCRNQFRSSWIKSSFGLPANDNDYNHNEALLKRAAPMLPLNYCPNPCPKAFYAPLIAPKFQFQRRQ